MLITIAICDERKTEEEEEEEWKQQQKRGDIGRLTETKYPSRLRLGLQPSSILMFVVVVVVCMCV